MTNSKVADWYDEFSTQQVNTGINLRHKSIHEWCLKFGLKKTDSVLEIGCGVGTQSQLIAEYLTKGKLTINDISEKSVDIARERLKKFNNISYSKGDIIEQPITSKFDFIILPDVIEHIPLENHFKLFEKLSTLLKDDGSILIHIPFPNYLEWTQEFKPELLQVIDQPITTDILAKNCYPNKLYIEKLITYKIWVEKNDYQAIKLKKKINIDFSVTTRKSSFKNKIYRKLSLILSKTFNNNEFNHFY